MSNFVRLSEFELSVRLLYTSITALMRIERKYSVFLSRVIDYDFGILLSFSFNSDHDFFPEHRFRKLTPIKAFLSYSIWINAHSLSFKHGPPLRRETERKECLCIKIY